MVMSAQLFNFPEKDKLAWHYVELAVRKGALERSGSPAIADRVVDVVRQAYERSVPPSISLRCDCVESMREDVVTHLHQIVGAMTAEISMIATDAEMLMVDHEPSSGRER